MSGGAAEYVMGNYNNTINSSGFTSMPDSKYYDKYTTTNSLTACNGGVCYGHGLSETSSWYGDYARFVVAGFTGFTRGGYVDGSGAGVFSRNYNEGNSNFTYGFRSVLSPIGA